MTVRTLPAEFADLSNLVPDWALGTEKERHMAMIERGIDEVRRLYAAMLPRYPAIVAHLDGKPLDALAPEDQTLLDLAMTFVETSHPIDLGWRTPDIEDTFPTSRLDYLEPSGFDG
jgi:hypothetical protein